MIRVLRPIFCLALVALSALPTRAFSLLGPFKTGANGGEAWQTAGFDGRPRGLGYTLQDDIGGPMFAFEGYRWTVPVITYAFDSTFLRYFGTNGVADVERAIEMLNSLPAASAMSETLDEYPLDTKAENGDAAALGLIDLKSVTLAILMEQLGLANPERFVFGLRSREVRNNFTNYAVVQMNYDPVSVQPSRYVNGVLYNYIIDDAIGPQGGEWASAVEWFTLDPLRLPYSSVAGGLGGNDDLTLGESPDGSGFFFGAQGLGAGQYYRGLTRDDIGGLRFLLSPNNVVVETLLPTVVPSTVLGKGSPWGPVFGTNIVGLTNVAVTNVLGTNVLAGFTTTALRPGVDKITFQRVNFDSILGTTFTPITNRYVDTFINPTNGRVVRQKVARAILRPDIIFAVEDADTALEVPFLYDRTTTATWNNNAALNTSIAGRIGGPGIIPPGLEITFSDVLPYTLGEPGSLDSDFPVPVAWGSFDGTDRTPVVYPVFQHPLFPELSLDYLRSLATQRR